MHHAQEEGVCTHFLDMSVPFSSTKEEHEDVVAALILFIEDDEHIRRQLAMSLTKEGYQVDEAGGGEEGLEAFDRHRADVVLVDLRTCLITKVTAVPTPFFPVDVRVD